MTILIWKLISDILAGENWMKDILLTLELRQLNLNQVIVLALIFLSEQKISLLCHFKLYFEKTFLFLLHH